MLHPQRPLASFSTLFQIYSPQPKPAKPEVFTASVVADLPPLEKQKIKIIVIAKKTPAAVTTSPVSPAPPLLVPAPPLLVPMPPAPVSPRTKKIKIMIKKQPQEKQKQPQEKQKQQTCFINDIAPPSSMFFKPYSDYIAPPPKCCRFFIDNRDCFLRSTDNACIDKITKNVFGFWNCEIGTNSKLLPVGDDDSAYEVCEEDFFCNHEDDDDIGENNENNDIKMRAEMRKKSDANRARLTGQPIALLRQKIAIKYGMQIRSIPTK